VKLKLDRISLKIVKRFENSLAKHNISMEKLNGKSNFLIKNKSPTHKGFVSCINNLDVAAQANLSNKKRKRDSNKNKQSMN